MEYGKLWGLEPFIHQVGGHSPLFCLDPATVCKPFEEREHIFYTQMPDCLLAYTPQFKGSMKVNITEDCDGYITLKGFPPNSYFNKHKNSSNVFKPKMRLKRCESIEIETNDLGSNCDQFFTDEKVNGEKLYNPWALKCHRDNLKKVGLSFRKDNNNKNAENSTYQQYILLENLTSRLKHPCVLDLKIGTRQYGDGASSTKKISKNAKVANSTSSSLGLRLGGMQVYQVSLSRYICRTKNFGRNLNVEGFKSAIRQFFCNGLLVRTDVINALLSKLLEFKKLLKGLDSFRFYTSSLLVIYDGSSSYHSGSRNSVELIPMPRNSFSTSSLSLISGSSNSCVNKERSRNRSAHESISRRSYRCGLRKRSLSFSNDRSIIKKHSPRIFDLGNLVDMRLIDFAHSTHKGLEDSSIHEGPDEGLLFGIDNLISILRDIEGTAGNRIFT